MRRHWPLLSLSVCLFSLMSHAQDTLSARQILEKSIEAQGGRLALENIRTVYTEFQTTMDGHDVHYVIKEMLPNKGSFEIVYQGRTVYKSFFDGQHGFEVDQGKKTAAPPDDNKDKMYKKNIFNELDYLDTALYTIKLLPDGTVGQTPAYVVSTTLKNGREQRIYYSKATFLQLKSETIKLAENERSDATLITKQDKYQNIVYPTVQRMFVGTDHEQTLTLLSIYFNEKVNDADFK
jgi:hypothetical protein